ncbi:MAG: HAD family hydrolase [Steroidobacteraceae bacterium]
MPGSTPMPVRALCFDLDDTFWEVGPVLTRAEAAMRAFLEREHPALASAFTGEDLWAERQALARAHPHKAHHMSWLRSEALRRIATRHGHASEVGEAAFAVFIEARSTVELFADVAPALERLSRTHRLGTFSNGNADVHRIGLGGHFTAVLNAEITGIAKPHPEAFEAAARALGVATSEMLYVGDDPRIDMEGARAAGCRTGWMNRRGLSWTASSAPPDLDLRSLDDLVAHLHG